MSLPTLIPAKLKELELTPTAAAQKFGIAYPSFAAVAAGESQPNSRTFKKYAKLLGISVDKVEQMVVAAKGSGKATRGRRLGSGRGRRAHRGSGLAKSLIAAADALTKAEAMLADDLAVTVHEMSAVQRRVLESVISGLR